MSANRLNHAEVVAEHAEFLRAGGVLSLADWRAMGDEQRAACADAGHLIALERAGMAGLAVTQPDAFEALLRGEEPGDVAQDRVMRDVLSHALARARGGPAS